MVLLGLVLGVVIAVVVAAQGCGSNHPDRKPFASATVAGAARGHA